MTQVPLVSRTKVRAGRSSNTVFNRFRRSTPGRVGLGIVLVMAVLAFLAPVLNPYDPSTDRSFREKLMPPSISALWNADLREELTTDGAVSYFKHPFGTDNLGRDIATRVWHGSRISLTIGVVATAAALIIGSLLGVFAGFFGGRFDRMTIWLSDVLLAFPSILLAIGISAVRPPSLSTSASLYFTMLAISIVQVPIYIRLMRGVVIGLREREFVQAASALGRSDAGILFGHVLPNGLSPLIVQASLSVATATVEAAALGFLGLGAQPPIPEWGTMIADAKDFYQSAPWTMMFPGFAILVSVLGFNLLGDGLRDALDPRSRA